MKGIYRRLVIIGLLLLLTFLLRFYLNGGISHLSFYVLNCSLPLQKAKSTLLNSLPFSLGDIVYGFLIVYLLFLIGQIVISVISFRKNKISFFKRTLDVLLFILTLYFIFLLSWGGNYYRSPLFFSGQKRYLKAINKDQLRQFNHFLVGKLNKLSDTPRHIPNFDTLNKQLNRDYHQIFGQNLPILKIKPSLAGNFLNYFGIQGYYNPLTGEGQLNRNLPKFLQPFLMAHEMAHQTGIAAEGEANLVAYLVGSSSSNANFRYSAYFSLFRYAYFDLTRKDTTAAKEVWITLNNQTKQDFKTLRDFYRPYRSSLQSYSNNFYDNYLKWNGQGKGMASYGLVVRQVYYWEFEDENKRELNLIPPK